MVIWKKKDYSFKLGIISFCFALRFTATGEDFVSNSIYLAFSLSGIQYQRKKTLVYINLCNFFMQFILYLKGLSFSLWGLYSGLEGSTFSYSKPIMSLLKRGIFSREEEINVVFDIITKLALLKEENFNLRSYFSLDFA